jgi:hypothetical protein
MRRVDISTGTDPGVTFAQHILHPRSPNVKSLCTAGAAAHSGGLAVPQPAGARRQPANQYRVRSFLCSPLLLYLEIPAWSPVPGLFCSALSIARRLTRNRASPNRRVHNRIAAGLAATVKLALCGFCTTDTNNILAENRWSLANRVRLHESVSSENSR